MHGYVHAKPGLIITRLLPQSSGLPFLETRRARILFRVPNG